MANNSKRLFRMFANGALSFVAVLMFAVPSYAEVVEFFTDFTAGCKPATTYRQNDTAASLAPYFSNFSFVDENGYSNLRYGENDDGFIILAAASGEHTSFQLTASSFLSSATCFDLTAGDLVYEAYYACGWTGVGTSSNQHGIAINGLTMRFIFHPGYSNGTTIDGAFRIEGSFGSCSNQNMGFIPERGAGKYTKMKLTIHRDEANKNYVFTTEFAPAESDYSDYAAYAYTHTCPIATIDAAGGIQSIGPFVYNNNNNNVTNLRLLAPFADDAVNGAKSTAELRDMFIASDKPNHWYKFDDSSTTTVKDYGSSPKDGSATNVNMSTISELNQVAEFSGSGSKVSVLDSPAIVGPWTAEFFLNAAQLSSSQSLLADGTYSLRLTQSDSLTPGFTHYYVKDYKFTNPDGGAFDTSLLTTNEWLHITFVNDGESMLFYLNGELVGKNTEELIKLPYAYIGSGGTGTNDYFSGMIDYVALYDYALSAEQIWNHAHPTPEPATWALLILGAAGMLCWRKRK